MCVKSQFNYFNALGRSQSGRQNPLLICFYAPDVMSPTGQNHVAHIEGDFVERTEKLY